MEKKFEKLHLHCHASTIFPFFFFFLSTLISVISHHKSEAVATTFIYAGCSTSKYQPNSPFQTNLDTLLSSIVSSSSQASYASFAVGNGTSSPADASVYGLYQCRNDLSVSDCSMCVQSTVGQLNLVCSDAYSASLQLDGCYVRYGNDNFLGQLDTTLTHKKCSPSTSNDGEFFRRRDDVLADLQNAVGFRVSSSGTVQGYAQCLGDLIPADCSSCLLQAVGQLKNACGSALAADVFLSKCYARYWASGYYPGSPAVSTDDDVGKTVAIIVGILAGLALFVVFLSFIKKALG